MGKKKQEPAFKTWDDVDAALKEIGDIDRKVVAAEIEMNETINAVKASAEDKTRFLIQRKEQLEKELELFTDSQKDDFKSSKTKTFIYGEVGFRKSTNIITRNIKAIIEALKQNNMKDCIDVTEKLNKDKLAEYDDESINKVGAKRKVGDKFFYKVAEERDWWLMGRKKDRQKKASARKQAEQARNETRKIVDRIMKGKHIRMKGAI